MSEIEVKLTPTYLMHQKGDFKVYACDCEDAEIKRNHRGGVTIKGAMPRLDLGVDYIVSIELHQIHKDFGASYLYKYHFEDVPESPEEQKEYLATVMTQLQLNEVYKVYSENDNIIELIKNKEFDWKKVKGFGEVVFERIYQKIVETLEYKEILSKFGKYGISYQVILTLAEELKCSRQLAIQKLQDNPYILCDYVSGWGFKRTDIVAKKMGVKHDDPHRIHTGIKYTIEENQQNGHTYMIKNDLLISASNILQLDETVIEKEIMNTDGLKIVDNEFVALQNTYNAEFNIARILKDMLSENIELDFNVEDFIEKIEKENDIDLTHQQRDFFKMIKNYRVGLLVGFAGSGKSALQKFLTVLLDNLKLTYTFLSPSAQAAKVSTQYTGVKAVTAHRKIGWGKDKKDQMLIEITEDFVIIDEAGMADVFITNQILLKMKNPNCRILFVGDPFQLPSVSAGNILHDMIESDVIPKTVLDIIFRQEEGGIVDVATMIRLKQKFVSNDFWGKKLFGKDFFLCCVDQGRMEQSYKGYYDTYLSNYEPTDIMTLSPTKKGKIGTVEINKYIQSKVNPKDGSKKEHPYGDDILFRTGDYVINTKNMYDICDYYDEPIELVNGDKGIIEDFVKDAESSLENNKSKYNDEEYRNEKFKEKNKNGVLINYTNLSKVRMDFKDISQLLHAWCITIHKSQGDAAPAVLIVADKSHKFQLSANLLYTAITRSKERCILITQAETLNYAIDKIENFRRKTFLQSLLKLEECMGVESA